MRNKNAEDKLMQIGMKYHQQMWAQVPTPKNMVTPMKKTSLSIQTQEQEIQENSILLNLNRPRQLQKKIGRCLNFKTVIKNKEISEYNDDPYNSNLKHLNRLQNKTSHCLNCDTRINTNKTSECNDDSPKHGAQQNDLEEVLYSEGEDFIDLYPDNTWESDDDICGDDCTLTAGWI